MLFDCLKDEQSFSAGFVTLVIVYRLPYYSCILIASDKLAILIVNYVADCLDTFS